MALRVQLSAGPSSQQDISARVRADTISVRTNAEEGSVAMSTVVVDDPNGDLIIQGLKGLYGFESESPANQTCLYRGFIADRAISRGETDKSFRTGAARQWAVTVTDQNTILSRRVLLGSDCNRPAETDVARVAWLMGTNELSTITVSTYVATTAGVAMDAADYRGQFCLDVLSDCGQASGRNYWVMFLESGGAGGGAYGLWYDFAASTNYASSLSISNVASDLTSVCIAASHDSVLTRDPSRVYSGVYMPYDGGNVYQELSATASNFQRRDTTSYSVNVKTAAKATARALRYLNDINTEEDRITTSIIVPNAQVNTLREGHLVNVRFSHFPGYESFVSVRVLNRTVTQVSEENYQLDLELGAGAPAVAVSNCPYPLTPAGSYPPNLSATTVASGINYYMRAGIGQPVVPTPGYTGSWHFSLYNSGGIDYAGDCDGNIIRVIVVGAGTLAVATTVYGGARTLTYTVQHLNGTVTVTDSSGTFALGTTKTLTIPNDGFCVHFIDITDDGSACGSKFGFAGSTWTPA